MADEVKTPEAPAKKTTTRVKPVAAEGAVTLNSGSVYTPSNG
ncbi:hypothetical protein [Sinorhizobium meliloti]|nr:hypothetical protein [Sinorhizobium meliloti]